MPIYEFYCPHCNTVYDFLSKTVSTDKRPRCPSCKKDILERQVSIFSATGSKAGPDDTGEKLPIDESGMEHAIQALAGEAERIGDDDPRQAARLMQKLSKMTGLQYNDTIQEAISRMEAGQDPAELEAQMGDSLDAEEPFLFQGKKGPVGKRPSRRHDPQLYEM